MSLNNIWKTIKRLFCKHSVQNQGIVKFEIENRNFEGVRCSKCGKIFGLSHVE